MISVIVATLLRPSLEELLSSLKSQTLERSSWELLTWQGEINEYAARNRAAEKAKGEILAFTDDDCLCPRDWLSNALKHFKEDPDLDLLTGPVEGDMYGYGVKTRMEIPWLYMGCNLFVKKKMFERLGGFEETWDISPPPKGWRSDSDLGFRIEEAGGKSLFAPDVLMLHPKQMKSHFNPDIEKKFYFRHREKCVERLVPLDPRLVSLILREHLEDDPSRLEKILSAKDKLKAQASKIGMPWIWD